uniref:Uncharacterized protein n=1 Tax=Davidia involucrata TaxID=16924 RepID=A0A5B7ACU8_DAVIN
MQPNGADAVSISIGEMLDRLSPSPSACCIFRVHNQLRSVNEKAYEPEIIAIGPYHRGKDNLQMMEEHKLRYLRFLLQRRHDSVDRYVIAIRSLEQEARKCYAEPIRLDGNELIQMMLLDGCFIIELLRKFEMIHLREMNDPIFEVEWIVNGLQRDMMLFENQLPFSILCKLFDMIEVPNQHHRLIYLALRFFRDLLPGPGYRECVDRNLHHKSKHLLALIHNNWLPSFAGKEPNGNAMNKENWQFIHCTTDLQEAGVKFKKIEEGTLFDIKFKNGVMHIPPLTIEDRTECFFRNLIAYEQYGPDNHLTYVTDYVKFMDCLIDSPKDVEVLCRYGIIDNWLGDAEMVSTIFNKITDSVTGPNNHFSYAGIFKKVNIHCNKRGNQWMAKLRRNYLNSPWALISVLAASVLLVLTLTQTVYAILGYNRDGAQQRSNK